MEKNNKRVFTYKGYRISQFEFDYSRNQNNKWTSYNTNDCNEAIRLYETFEDALDTIDYLIDNRTWNE